MQNVCAITIVGTALNSLTPGNETYKQSFYCQTILLVNWGQPSEWLKFSDIVTLVSVNNIKKLHFFSCSLCSIIHKNLPLQEKLQQRYKVSLQAAYIVHGSQNYKLRANGNRKRKVKSCDVKLHGFKLKIYHYLHVAAIQSRPLFAH